MPPLEAASTIVGTRMSKYLEILFRHRLRFLALFFLLPAVVASAVVFLYPHQVASASLWVDTPTYIEIAPSATGWNQYLTPSQNTVDALNQLMGTNSFYKTLAERLDAANTFSSVDEKNSVMANLGSDLTKTATGSHLVVLDYTCPRKPVCVAVLGATLDIYRDWLASRQQAQAKIALDFYTKQLADAQATLQTNETAFANYIATHPDVKATDTAINPELDQLYRAVTDDRATVNSLQSKLDNLRLTNAAAVQIQSTVLNVIDAPRIISGGLGSLPRKQLAIAEILCLVVAVAVLAVMAWSDRSVRDPKELQARLRVPVVAAIPDLTTARVTSRV
jgi:uncharacterized protein involved in exopolysaccharide biosynthesis